MEFKARARPPAKKAEGAAARPALREYVYQEGAFPTRGIPLMRVGSVGDASPPAAEETLVKNRGRVFRRRSGCGRLATC